MRVYLASPNTQQQADAVRDMPVLLSYAIWRPWMDQYARSFSRLLIDSGAYSEFTTGQKIDVGEYADWSLRWGEWIDAVAGLDDISGDWRRSLQNYDRMPWAFPTIHNTDPDELLGDLVARALAGSKWLGIGLKPPRQGKEPWIRRVMDRVPPEIHLHGWACRAYMHLARFDSVDSTNWWRDGMAIRSDLPWLTYGEALDIVVKRYQREPRYIAVPAESSQQLSLEVFDGF